ncbi:adenosylcobinamide-GDP ribazoletransferase [Novosphingobium sp. PhB165]|uniref:adenosylcobinamide-GDP ribazoletransferase n=1 Tax=Novosphingobium sp. PhB165 TaxID=2485105 RepID=UPI00104FA7B6|nr:adenosylcobinamide-GDP ribazoletransferase [Novosphingobium sp. PhB165]
MRQVVLALQFLTRLPLPAVRADNDDFAKSMRWFPLAGLVVGALVAGCWWLGAKAGADWLAALAGLVAWVAVTGALHLDGLGDIADATGAAHKDRARLSAVLADPHVGSFAVVTIVLQLLAKLVLLHALMPGQVWALLLVPALARIGPLFWTMALPPLHEGLGSRFRSAIRWPHLAVWCLLAVLAGALIAPSLLVLFLAVPLWGCWLKSRIGGISGDGHGAGIELVETALLAALVVLR